MRYTVVITQWLTTIRPKLSSALLLQLIESMKRAIYFVLNRPAGLHCRSLVLVHCFSSSVSSATSFFHRKTVTYTVQLITVDGLSRIYVFYKTRYVKLYPHIFVYIYSASIVLDCEARSQEVEVITVWVQKIPPPLGDLTFFIFFTNGWEFVIDFSHLLNVPIFAR